MNKDCYGICGCRRSLALSAKHDWPGTTNESAAWCQCLKKKIYMSRQEIHVSARIICTVSARIISIHVIVNTLIVMQFAAYGRMHMYLFGHILAQQLWFIGKYCNYVIYRLKNT
jgi:hypothetical protein